MKARFLEPLDHTEPHGPDRIDQDIGVVGLDQKRSVPNPGNANLARLDLGEQRPGRSGAGTFREERWDPDAGNKIALGPVASRAKLHSLGFFRAGLLRVANDLPLSRKRIRHSRTTI